MSMKGIMVGERDYGREGERGGQGREERRGEEREVRKEGGGGLPLEGEMEG